MRRREIPTKRRQRMAIGWFILAVILLAVLIAAAAPRSEVYDIREDRLVQPVSEETTIHTQEPQATPYPDIYLLAKIMQEEAGVNWPDWAVMCIGEVVLNRVDHDGFPNTISEVLYQKNPVQYAPVWTSSWGTLEPEEQYIDLARRLLDGERVLNNPDVVWQALFPQGERTVITYYDKILNTTTYFCE